MKNKKINSEKVKAILKKSIDVFCYVITALALTLGIAMGVNSCSGSNEPKRIDPQQESPSALRNVTESDDFHIYVNRYSGSLDVDFSSIRESCNVPTTISATQRVTRSYSVWLSTNGDNPSYFYYNGEFVSLLRLRWDFSDLPVQEGTPQYEYVLTYAYAITESGWITLYARSNLTTSEGDLGSFADGKLILTTDSVNDLAVSSLLVESEKSTFTFNAEFNYNAPFGLPYNAVYGSSALSWSGGGPTMKYMTYQVGWFWSNGRLFDRLQWWAIKGDGVAVVIDSQITTLPESDNWVYNRMDYVNSVSGESVMVNSRDSIPYNSGNSRYYANSSTWQVPAYRNITLLSTPSEAISDLLGSFNNNNQYDTGGLSVGGDMGDVFTLVGGAFTGLLPILTLQILPSVTIGTLLFVPLVAMLVFAIIRIIKK